MTWKSVHVLVLAVLLAACGRHANQNHAAPAASPAASNTAAEGGDSELPPLQATIPDEGPAAAPAQPAPSSAAGVPGDPIVIPAHTRIRVRLAQGLDTRRVRAGQRFTAYLDDAIVSGGRVIVPKGAAFEGRITEAKNSGRLRGRAYLGLTLENFRYNGARYAIATVIDVRASASHKKRNLEIIGGGATTGAAVGAIAAGPVGAAVGAGAGAAAGTTGAILTGRKIVHLPAETVLVFSLRAPVTVRT